MSADEEIWKDIPQFFGVYKISDLGRLKSYKKDPNGYVLSNKNSKGGYLSIVLKHNKIVRSTRIHSILQVASKNEYKPGKTRKQAGGFQWKFYEG